MVVKLKPDQFTAGDMIFMVRSRRRARPDPRFYGENVGKIQIENKKKEEALFKDSNEYFNSEPQTIKIEKKSLNRNNKKE